MYRQFYGFTKYPFDLSPDPGFFCATPRHNEVLASVYHGVQRRKGFVVVTGEVGTGKTLLARCLFSLLERDRVAFGYVFNPLLNSSEFLQYSLADLGLRVANRSKVELLFDLNHFLIVRYRQGSTAVLVIDEAHLLSWELLEEIRLLTNLETGHHKLLQIVMMGQPEFDRKLDSPDLRQLKQRIALRCRLGTLSEAETATYICRRLAMAGCAAGETVFPADTISLIHGYSRGTPRLINTICENALISGFAAHQTAIGPELIEEVAADLCLTLSKPASGETIEITSRSAAVPA
jgi:general secretion pathway protein A